MGVACLGTGGVAGFMHPIDEVAGLGRCRLHSERHHGSDHAVS
jgi:hypothetical protein